MKEINITTIDQLKSLDLSDTLITENTSISIKLRLVDTEVNYPIKVKHIIPGLSSNIYIKLALFGKSKAKMPVEIHVESGAINTSTSFKALVLLMSEKAQANITPGLYIHEKNILSASHGVVIKNIKDKDLAYIRARGINKQTAKEMLVQLG